MAAGPLIGQMRVTSQSPWMVVLAGALAWAAPAAAAAPAGSWHAEPARYGVSAAAQHMVTMSDGVQLAADVYRPTTSSGAPARGPLPGDPVDHAVRQALGRDDGLDGRRLWGATATTPT